jgi:hypothetical protein
LVSIYSRVDINESNEMFIPMNMLGSVDNDAFWTPAKGVTAAGIALSLAVVIVYSVSVEMGFLGWVIMLGLWALLTQIFLRKIIFQEKYYMKMYRELAKHEIDTPNIFWNISGIEELDEGALCTYADGKIAIIVRCEKDTITGRDAGFLEEHYSAWSNLYKSLCEKGYLWVQMNIMEEAGKDDRINTVSKDLLSSVKNQSLKEIMEKQLGHIKRIANNSLYENEYIMVYTTDANKVQYIEEDIKESFGELMLGAFSGIKILGVEDITDLLCEMYGVGYFDLRDATLRMFENNGTRIKSPFKIVGMQWEDGTVVKFDSKDQYHFAQIIKRNIRREVVKDEELYRLGIEEGSTEEEVLTTGADLGEMFSLEEDDDEYGEVIVGESDLLALDSELDDTELNL